MVNAIRHVEQALGDGKKIPGPSEFSNRAIARKSLVALCDIRTGEMFTEANLGIKRPGSGILGMFYWEWLGKTARQDYKEDDTILDSCK